MNILTEAQLLEEGKKVAKLAGNRDFKDKIIKQKQQSLKETGLLIPAVIVPASKAIEEGLNITDFQTGEAVSPENAGQYVVLVDANHRYKAHLENKKEGQEYNKDFYFMYPLNDGLPVTKMLSEINIATNPWTAGDYGNGAVLVNKDKDIPMLIAINELTAKGYSLSTASKWLTFTGKINKEVMAKAMNGDIADVLIKNTTLKRGQELLESAGKVFSEQFLSSRTLIDWIISKYNEVIEQEGDIPKLKAKLINMFSGMTRQEVDDIEHTKGTRGGNTKESIINEKLNAKFNSLN